MLQGQSDANKYINQARHIVRNNVLLNQFNRSTDREPEKAFDVYVVWFCKVLQNWKALVSTTLPDGRYYEVTFDGDKNCAYLDTYAKVDNKQIGGRDPYQDGTIQKTLFGPEFVERPNFPDNLIEES